MDEYQEGIQLREDVLKVSDYFYQNRIAEGMEVLPEFIHRLMTFSSRVTEEDVAVYTNILKNLMESMETKNYILLADLLVFELDPILDQYIGDGQ